MKSDMSSTYSNLQYCDLLNQICKPLEKLGITYFAEISISKKGFLSILSNRSDWLQGFLKKECYRVSLVIDHPSSFSDGYYLARHLNKNTNHDRLCDEARDLYNIDNNIIFIEKKVGVTYFYYFAAEAENTKIINFYLNNIALLRQFILYFKVQALQLRNLNMTHAIHVKNYGSILSINSEYEKDNSDNNVNYWINELTPNYYIIDINGTNIKFSKREVECIFCLLSGKTSREAADILRISTRTVENYIDNLKLKINCYRKSEIIDKLFKTDLADIFRLWMEHTCIKSDNE